MNKPTTKTVALRIAGFTPDQIELVKRTVAKGATDDELKMFIHISKKNGLDPFNKEIWFYKDTKGNTLMFAGRDGFLKIAQVSKEFGGLKSGVIRKNDIAEIDIQNNIVSHKFKPTADRGPIVGAWATAYRKGAEPCTVYVENSTFNKGYNAWKTHPEEMLKKVAEAHALKKLFGISGINAIEEKDSILSEGKDSKEAATEITGKAEIIIEDPVNDVKNKLIMALGATDESDAVKKINEKLLTSFISLPATVIEVKTLYGKILSHNNQNNGN